MIFIKLAASHRGIPHQIGTLQQTQALKYCKIKLKCIVKYNKTLNDYDLKGI